MRATEVILFIDFPRAQAVQNAYGGGLTDAFIVSLADEDSNLAPTITSSPVSEAQLREPYTYRVVANDPDLDPLAYRLTAAPPDVSIDEATGLITWTPPTGGVFTVAIAVVDDHGGTATQRYDVFSLDDDVKLYFALNNALMDAGIAAWDAKRVYDYVRPISALRFLKRGEQIRAWIGPYEGIHEIDGSHWRPYQPLAAITPPFAEYVSGHSTFSAAAAQVLRSFTGSDAFGASHAAPAGESIAEPGLVPKHDLTLRWATFSEAADQAGLSRQYGGIHFQAADRYGHQMGELIGAQVWAKALTYFSGTAEQSREESMMATAMPSKLTE